MRKKNPSKCSEMRDSGARQQDRAGLLQDKGVTQWALMEEGPRLGGESWSWFSQSGVLGGGKQRQMDTDHTEQQPRQPDCPFLTKQIIDKRRTLSLQMCNLRLS